MIAARFGMARLRTLAVTLLACVLPSLATNRSLQRILEEYIEQLAAVSS